MASDGKWYPPHLHPDAPRPSGPDAPPPGWWLASDGTWYPPHLHPDAPRPSGADAPAPGSWMASDGNWYPPESRPAAVTPLSPAAARPEPNHRPDQDRRPAPSASPRAGRPTPTGSALGEDYLDELFAEMRRDRRIGDGVWRGTIGFTPPPAGPPLRSDPEEFFEKSNGKAPSEQNDGGVERSAGILSRFRRRSDGSAPVEES